MFVSQTFQSFTNIWHSGFVFSTFGHLALMEDATNGARSTNHSYLRTSRSTWGRRCPWIIFPIKNNTGTKRVMFRLLREAIKVKTENKLLFIFFSTLMTSIREKWGTFVSPGTLAGLKRSRKLDRPPCNDYLFKVKIGNWIINIDILLFCVSWGRLEVNKAKLSYSCIIGFKRFLCLSTENRKWDVSVSWSLSTSLTWDCVVAWVSTRYSSGLQLSTKLVKHCGIIKIHVYTSWTHRLPCLRKYRKTQLVS